MLVVASDLSSFTLGAGEPFLLQVAFHSADGTPADIHARAFVLTFYRADRTNMNQIEGVADSDSSGAFVRFEADGTFSEQLATEGALLVEFAERYLNGRRVYATGNIRVSLTARSVPSLGSAPIGAFATRVVIQDAVTLGGAPSFTQSQVLYVPPGLGPLPSILSHPTIATDGTPQVGETLTGSGGTYANGSVSSRAWLLGGTAISGATGATYVPTAAGSLVYREVVTGPAGQIAADSDPVTVAAATVPQLTLGGPLAFSTSAAAGTLVATISGVPSGVAPTLTLGDGRLVIAGDATSGWKVVVGMTAASAGSISLSVTAAGATTMTTTVTVTVPGALAISALYATQPQATQRWYLATATAPVTWSISAGFTITAIDSLRAVWSANADNVGATGGSTNLTLFPTITATPAGGGTPATAAPSLTLTPIAATGAISPSYASGFTGSAGTALETVAGWSKGSGGAGQTPTLDGAGHLVGRSSGSNDVFILGRSLGVTLANSTVTFDQIVRPAAGTGGDVIVGAGYNAGGTVGVRAWFYVDNSHILLNKFSLLKPDGTVTDQRPVAGIDWGIDGIAHCQFVFSDDGNSVQVVLATSAQATSYTFDLTGLAMGAQYGFVSPGGGAVACIATGIKVGAINAVAPATGLTIVDNPSWSGDNTLTAPCRWTKTKPTGFIYRFVDWNTGAAVTNWMTGVASINDDGTATCTGTMSSGGSYRMQVAPYNDTGVVATAPYRTTFFYAYANKKRLGFNLGSANYFAPRPVLADVGLVSLIDSNVDGHSSQI